MSHENTMPPHVLRNVLDACIIGSGPAGLSAALSLGRVLRSAVVFDSGEYRYQTGATTHATYDHDNPALIRNGMKAELHRKYKTITFATAEAMEIREIGSIFQVEDGTGRLWKGRKVILATGSSDIFPDIPGYMDSWEKGIFNCLHRRGFEESGTPVAAILTTSTSEAILHDAITSFKLANQFSRSVWILTNGLTHLHFDDAVKEAEILRLKVDDRKIKKLSPAGHSTSSLMEVEFEDGSISTFGFIFHKNETTTRGGFANDLGLKTTSSGEIITAGPMQETSKRGVYAAGDCATPVKEVAVAIGTGAAAGYGVNAQILEDDYTNSW
ncbi:thioredoxin reductase [Colletotrichum truncatum]|uniref:Thioredoxin reductase n=1 Tax=Colletotrichum truncatum TaxID=5467 RepID=A0ACC3Z8S5_COLTU|nr:thioredoxin reductase [Colletotrichum truncatum]KAF6789255.1 thioredoxin reductase [Colletotrichum truncatum]